MRSSENVNSFASTHSLCLDIAIPFLLSSSLIAHSATSISMIASSRLGTQKQLRHACAGFALARSHSGRTAAYRRLSTLRPVLSSYHSPLQHESLSRQLVLPHRIPNSSIILSSTLPRFLSARVLHTSSPRLQQPRPSEDIRDPPRESQESGKNEAGSKTSDSEDGSGKRENSDQQSESKEEPKKDQPPPPPHGDKSPWQVFRETLSSEFKASKEWNESTRQLASSAHQFTESQGVQNARNAYNATAGAATSKTGEALKYTGKALGQGAAWTWDTKVVQGVREGVNATGRGIEKATRPVRETKTFQSIKEAVDDGSSSRYGGWVEKEERRKKKELRDLKEVQSGTRPAAKMEEDPK